MERNCSMKEIVYQENWTPENKAIDILDEGIYKNYHYAIVSFGSHPCAYIELPKGHKYYGKDYDDIPIDCHGGLTYSSEGILPSSSIYHRDGYWIGWDYAHLGDYCGWFNVFDNTGKKWTTEEILQEVKEVIEQLSK